MDKPSDRIKRRLAVISAGASSRPNPNVLRDIEELRRRDCLLDSLRAMAEPPEAIRLLRRISQSFEFRPAIPKPPLSAPATPPSPPSRRSPPELEELEAWYREYILDVGESNRDQDLPAARARFGSWAKDRDDVRALRSRKAPGEWHKPGPKIRQK
jgi:hypothetical protein